MMNIQLIRYGGESPYNESRFLLNLNELLSD